MAARDVVEAEPSRSITVEDNDISSYLTEDPYEGLLFEHNVLGLRTEQARAEDFIAEGDRLFTRLPAIDATADRSLLDTLSESFTALVNDPMGEVSRSFRSYYNTVNQAANTLFGTGEILLSGAYNGAVEVVGGAASVPYLFDSVDAAVAVQARFSDHYSYDLRSDGAQWVVEDVLAPAGTFINDNLLQPSRTFSENLMGDGATTALFAGVNAGVQIAGVLTGTKGLSAAFRQVDAPDRSNAAKVGGASHTAQVGSYGQIFDNTVYFAPVRELPNDLSVATERAIELANKYGAEIDTQMMKFVSMESQTFRSLHGDKHAIYGEQFTPTVKRGGINEVITFEKWPNSSMRSIADENGVVTVVFDAEVLRSDARSIAVFAHESKEIRLVESHFEAKGRITLSEYDDLTKGTSNVNYHGQAVRAGDQAAAKYLLDQDLVSREELEALFRSRY